MYERSTQSGYGSQSGSSYSSHGSAGRPAPTNEIRGTDIIAEYLVKEKVPVILGYAGHGAIGRVQSSPSPCESKRPSSAVSRPPKPQPESAFEKPRTTAWS